jgi:UDP-N-acetyl-D-mannosaminuronic acid dehydrogenase
LEKRKVALLGITFKGDTDDIRGSLALRVKRILEKRGCKVHMHDPFLFPNKTLKEALRKTDIVIFSANHSAYRNLKTKSLRKLIGKRALLCDPGNILGENKVFFWI